MKKLFSLFFFVFSFSVYSQHNFKVADSVLVSYNKPGSPGVTVLVSKDGKVIYQKSGGYANIEKGELITDKTLFNLASDTKQFTAACIIMLSQKGKLKLDDNLAKYFPDFPEYAQKITIQDLLNHTSGLMDYQSIIGIKGKEVEDMTNGNIRTILKGCPLNFEPKTEWSYSNSNYWFLVQIVEHVSGMSIAKFAEKNIFKPLKMKDTYYERDVRKVKDAARGYKYKNEQYFECDIDMGVFGGSGIFSTTADMLKWLDDMHSKKILGAAFWDAMLNGTKYRFDKNGLYSNGLEFVTYYGKKRIYHGGDVNGYHSVMSYFPDDKLNIIVFTNRGDFDVATMHRAIASQFLGFKFSWPVEKPEFVQSSKDVLEQYTGGYEAEEMIFDISLGSKGIHVSQVADKVEYDIAQSGDALFTFAEVGANLFFQDIVNGKAQEMKLTQDGESIIFKRTDNYKRPDYTDYVGVYRCKSLDVDYVFLVKEGRLFYTIGKREALPVNTLEEDTMKTVFDLVTFQRNPDGKVTGFILNHPRVKNLEFVKI